MAVILLRQLLMAVLLTFSWAPSSSSKVRYMRTSLPYCLQASVSAGVARQERLLKAFYSPCFPEGLSPPCYSPSAGSGGALRQVVLPWTMVSLVKCARRVTERRSPPTSVKHLKESFLVLLEGVSLSYLLPPGITSGTYSFLGICHYFHIQALLVTGDRPHPLLFLPSGQARYRLQHFSSCSMQLETDLTAERRWSVRGKTGQSQSQNCHSFLLPY